MAFLGPFPISDMFFFQKQHGAIQRRIKSDRHCESPTAGDPLNMVFCMYCCIFEEGNPFRQNFILLGVICCWFFFAEME
jgi:hypothetical protein